MERDNKVFSLRFDGLPEYPNGTAYLHIDCGENGADSIEVVDGTAEIKRNVTQYEGEKEAYVEILADGDVVWHSDVIMVTVKRLPILGEKIEQAYPTAFEQALAQTAADKAAAAKSAADAAAAAAGIVTEEAARQDAESERVKAEAARETAEGNREKAEAAREQEMAEALASVVGVENVVRANEQQRMQEEQRRETAETDRAEAERQRKSTETSRQTAETARNAAESGRVTAEKTRVSDESQRQQAETARADAEDKRVQAEQGRVTAEHGRVEAETKREEAMAQHAKKIAELETEVSKKAQIDDTTVSDTEAWSSQPIVDMLCPPLEESGNPVICYPVANSNLDIVANWEPTQNGEGTPYPAGGGPNLLDISQCTTVYGKPFGLTITIDGDIIKASGIPSSEVTKEGEYGFAVVTCAQTELRGKGYKVTAFAVKGNVSSAWGLRTENEDSIAVSAKLTPGVDTDIQVRLMVSKDTPAAYAPYANIRPIKGRDNVSVTRQEDELSVALTLSSTIYGGEVGADGEGQETYGCIESYAGETLPAGWICDRAAYAEGATPPTGAQVAYKLATPIPFTATGGGTIKALSGTNTILTDADTLTVTGRADPIHIIQQLQAASTASAQALADVERAVTDI